MTSFLASTWTRRTFGGLVTAALVALAGCASPGSKTPVGDPLPSWRDGPAKTAITDFVADVSREGSKSFVPKEELSLIHI